MAIRKEVIDYYAEKILRQLTIAERNALIKRIAIEEIPTKIMERELQLRKYVYGYDKAKYALTRKQHKKAKELV